MAISFLQEDIDLDSEQWKTFYKNINSSEFEVEGIGTFSFSGEGTPEFDYCDRRFGVMTYVVEDLEEELFYLFKVNFSFSDHYDLNENNKELTLEAVSKTDSLNY